jgi:hypothetical protein
MSLSPHPEARIEFHHGRPVIVFGGRPLSQAMYSDPRLSGQPTGMTSPEEWLQRNREFCESGVHNYSLQILHGVDGDYTKSRFWTDDGVYPEVSPEDDLWCVDKQAAALLEMDPEAVFFVRFGDQIPSAWFAANPDHQQMTYDGRRRLFQGLQPSQASRKALDDTCVFLRKVLEYCEDRDWAERLWGYMYYPRGEGITNLNVGGVMFDVAPVMQEAYREFLEEKYGDEHRMQEAWNDPSITFDTVRVPTDPEWREEITAMEFIREGEQHTDFQGGRARVQHWPDGNQLRRFRDYWELQRRLFLRWNKALIRTARETLAARRPVVFGMDIAKQPMFGWQHNMSFGGYGPGWEFIDMFIGTGSVDVGELLDEPGLDMLCTPADYTARNVGYGFESEGIADSLHLRGGALLCENDCRTFAPGEDHTAGAFRDPAEVRAGMLRNAAWSLSRGHFDYWMIAGGAYFHHPLVHEHGIRVVTPILDAAPRMAHRETEHAIALIIDDTAPWYEDGTSGFENQAVLWQRVVGLAHCGVPYRVYLFSDLEKENMPPYRAYLFPNLFRLDEDRLALLARQVFTDGRMAIFGPATGITDGRRLSAEGASRLLGVEMELHKSHAPRRVIVGGEHPLVEALPAALTYGDSSHYGPILVPAEGALEQAGAVELGMATLYWSLNRPGLFLRETETHRIAWSAAAPLPAALLRELARSGDCHIWCEDDDVVLASETVAALHSVKCGPRVLKLPSARPVWDLLTGEKLGGALAELPMYISPPETRAFYLAEEAPF